MRYRMLSIVRVFAAQQLTESRDEAATHLAHAQWVRDTADKAAQDWVSCDGSQVAARLNRLEPEIAAALVWTLHAGHTPVASSIARAVTMCLHWTPGLELCELLIEVADHGVRAPGRDVAHGVAAGAFFAGERGAHDRARHLARAALQMSGPGEQCLLAWLTLAVASMYAGDHAESAVWFHRIASVPRLTGEGHTSLALLACYAGDLTAAHEHVTIALAAGSAASDASYAFARYAAGEVESRTDR